MRAYITHANFLIATPESHIKTQNKIFFQNEKQ